MKRKHLWWFLTGLGVVYLFVRLVAFFSHPGMHDFQAYYFASKVASMGGNPYDLKELQAASGSLSKFPFFYPPYVLYFFKPFTFLDDIWAFRLFLALKVVSLMGLIRVWLEIIPRNNYTLGLTILITTLAAGFHESAIVDLRYGNISIFEQIWLWLGFLAYINRRLALFAVFVVLASLAKIYLIVFLGLLLFVPGRKGWSSMIAGALFFVGVNGVSFLTQRTLYNEFLGLSYAMNEGGSINPCTLALVREVFEGSSAIVVYLFLVLIVTGLFLRRIWQTRSKFLPLDIIMGAVLLMILAAPRMKDYSYVLLILPTTWFVLHLAVDRPRWAFGLVFLVFVGVLAYQSLLVALLLFLWWLRGPSAWGLQSNISHEAR